MYRVEILNSIYSYILRSTIVILFLTNLLTLGLWCVTIGYITPSTEPLDAYCLTVGQWLYMKQDVYGNRCYIRAENIKTITNNGYFRRLEEVYICGEMKCYNEYWQQDWDNSFNFMCVDETEVNLKEYVTGDCRHK